VEWTYSRIVSHVKELLSLVVKNSSETSYQGCFPIASFNLVGADVMLH
jgi:hypothetical protein